MEELLEGFFKEIDPLIKELRRKEKIKEDKISHKFEALNIKREIRERTEKFIYDYKTIYENEIENLKNKIAISEDSAKRITLEKELSDAEKELASFNEIMGVMDLSNSKYTYFLQALIGRMEEKTMSRMSDGVIYDHGRKIEDMNNFTVEDALNIVNEEDNFQDTELVEDEAIEEQTGPVAYKEDEFDEILMADGIKEKAVEEKPIEEAVEDIENEEQSKENLEKLLGLFKEIEYGFDGLFSKEYLWLKKRIIEDNQYEKAIKSLEGLTLEDIYVKILNHLKKDYSRRETVEKMLSAVKARREEMNKKDSQEVKEENKPIHEAEIKIFEKPNYPSVKWKKKPSVFDNIKKRVKDWFLAKMPGNKENEVSEGVITEKEEQEAFMNAVKEGVEQPIVPEELFKDSNGKIVNFDDEKTHETEHAM